MKKKTLSIIVFSLVFANAVKVYSQELNAIQTVVPFLTIAPDSRAGAMGDAGVATSPDVYSQHWNPSKFAFIDGKAGVGISYSPWLRNLVPDINIAYLTGYYRIDKRQVASASLLIHHSVMSHSLMIMATSNVLSNQMNWHLTLVIPEFLLSTFQVA